MKNVMCVWGGRLGPAVCAELVGELWVRTEAGHAEL